VQVASKEIEKISSIVQRLYHPDLQDESLRHCVDPLACNQHHRDAFCADTTQNEQPGNLAPASPSSRDLLRRLKRGHLLRYERDEEDQDVSVSASNGLVDRIKREARFLSNLSALVLA
jgi:hypothetical protein